jgi:hypothetical protein
MAGGPADPNGRVLILGVNPDQAERIVSLDLRAQSMAAVTVAAVFPLT